MKQLKRITATKARNDFFNLLKKSFLEKQTFIIEKGEIPMVYLVPVSEIDFDQKAIFDQKAAIRLLKKLEKFRASMKETSDSVKLLREIRKDGK